MALELVGFFHAMGRAAQLQRAEQVSPSPWEAESSSRAAVTPSQRHARRAGSSGVPEKQQGTEPRLHPPLSAPRSRARTATAQVCPASATLQGRGTLRTRRARNRLPVTPFPGRRQRAPLQLAAGVTVQTTRPQRNRPAAISGLQPTASAHRCRRTPSPTPAAARGFICPATRPQQSCHAARDAFPSPGSWDQPA